jgi:hypothetical protein
MTFISPPSRLVDLLGRHAISHPRRLWDDYRGVTTFRGVTLAKRRYFILKETGGGKLRVDFRSWPLVIVIGLLLALLSILDRGGLSEPTTPVVQGTACEFTVNADGVNVRTGATAASPSVQKLARGQTVVATPTVTSGFRQLADGTWVLDGLLTPVPNSPCT